MRGTTMKIMKTKLSI